jgi:hypothetical protein
MSWKAKESGFNSRQGKCISFISSDLLWDPPGLLLNGYRGLFALGVEWLGRKAILSPPSSAEVNNEWKFTSTRPYIFVV